MKEVYSKIVLGCAMFAMVGAMSSPALATTIDFVSLPGTGIEFNGTSDTFTFTTRPDGFTFVVTSPGPASGLLGAIDGTFTIPMPEPTSLVLFGSGLVGLGIAWRMFGRG